MEREKRKKEIEEKGEKYTKVFKVVENRPFKKGQVVTVWKKKREGNQFQKVSGAGKKKKT